MAVQEQENIAESVRSGRYFTEARAWYQAVYLSPVSSRTLFLLIAILAVLVAIFAIASVSTLLPVTKREGLIVSHEGGTDAVELGLAKLNPEKRDVNEALASFFARQFTVSAETWVAEAAAANSAFIQAHSNEKLFGTYAQYAAQFSKTLGPNAARQIEVVSDNVTLTKDHNGTAKVKFIAHVTGSDALPQKSQWTAKLKFTYTPLSVEAVKDTKTGEESMNVTDPQFQVTDYAVETR